MRTRRAKVHETGDGDDPEVLGVDKIATVELGEVVVLDTWMGERNIKRRADQKAIGQQIVQGERNIWDNTEPFKANGQLVSHRSRYHALEVMKLEYTTELTVFDIGNRLNVEGCRGEHGREREHYRSVGYESPLDTLPSAVGRVK